MNSEIPEIFRTRVTFIQNIIDPTFSIDYNKLDENHLINESNEQLSSAEEAETIHHHHVIDLIELESCQFNDIHNNNDSEGEKNNNKANEVNKKTILRSAWYTIQVEKNVFC